MRTFYNDCFYTIVFFFNLLNFLCVGRVNITFQSARTGKYATPTGHLNFHFTALVVSYKLPVKSETIEFLPDRTQQYNILQFSLEKWPVCSIF